MDKQGHDAGKRPQPDGDDEQHREHQLVDGTESVTVTSPRLNGAPPPIRPRTIISPDSGRRTVSNPG
jgi:hypothetical protein